MRALPVGLAAAVVCGSAAAAAPTYAIRVHARLAPVTGTTAAGRFSGLLAKSALPPQGTATVVPRVGQGWRLSWKLSLPSLRGPVTASLRISGKNGAPPVARVLCRGCSTTANGRMPLTASQALRVAGSDAVIVVRARSATLRGRVKASTHIPVAARG
jgi:hypothetical protein